MTHNQIYKYTLLTLFCFATLWLSGCQASNTTGDNSTTVNRNPSPQRVDIRGSIVTTRYNEGQVVIEVEGFAPTPDSRYSRAYVLVQPTAQLFGPDGQSISLSELHMGQQVAVILRGGGRGNLVGVGIARKLWVEDRY